MGLGEKYKGDKINKFTYIDSLWWLKIKSASAGYLHSLFVTDEGRVLGCGTNRQFQLFNEDRCHFYEPAMLSIKSGANICIDGEYSSAVFIGEVQQGTPNLPLANKYDRQTFQNQERISKMISLLKHKM